MTIFKNLIYGNLIKENNLPGGIKAVGEISNVAAWRNTVISALSSCRSSAFGIITVTVKASVNKSYYYFIS